MAGSELICSVSAVYCYVSKENLTNGHAVRNIRVLYHFSEFLKANLTITVEIGLHNSLVDDLAASHD